jgi:hypothetical protein
MIGAMSFIRALTVRSRRILLDYASMRWPTALPYSKLRNGGG